VHYSCAFVLVWTKRNGSVQENRMVGTAVILVTGGCFILSLHDYLEWIPISGRSPLGAFLEHLFFWFYPICDLWACSVVAPKVVNGGDSPKKHTLNPWYSFLCRRLYKMISMILFIFITWILFRVCMTLESFISFWKEAR